MKKFSLYCIMEERIGVHFINKGHKDVVSDFLEDIQKMISDYVLYEEDFYSYKSIILGVVEYHNSAYHSVKIGALSEVSWMLAMPNNVYWATLGFLSSVRPNENVKRMLFDEKMLSLIIDTITNLESLGFRTVYPADEDKIYLN